MAEIKITDLNLNGNDLFDDEEDFMNDLSEDVFEQVKGGNIIAPPPPSPTDPYTEPINPYPCPLSPKYRKLTLPCIIPVL